MNVYALLIALAAIVIFAVDYVRRTSAHPKAGQLLPLGLAVFVASVVVQLVLQVGATVHIHS